MPKKRKWIARKGARRGTCVTPPSHGDIGITTSERKVLNYKREYDKRTYRQIAFALNVDKEKELIDYLDSLNESPKQLFARLIRADMAEKAKERG